MPNKYSTNGHETMHKIMLASIYLVLCLLILDNANAEGISNSKADAITWETYATDTFLRGIPLVGPLVASSPSKTLMQFYPVENWEIQVCTRDVTSMKDRKSRNANAPSGPRVWYDGASIALSASVYTYKVSGDMLYSADWYVLPKNNAATYSLYFKDSSGKKIFINSGSNSYVNIAADPAGSVGSLSMYVNVSYSVIGIEYIEFDVNNKELSRNYLETDIVPDTKASFG